MYIHILHFEGWIRIHIIKDIYLPHRSSCSSPFSLFSTLFYIFFCQSACTRHLFLCICLCLSPSLYFAAFSYIFFCLNFSVSLYAVSHVHQSHIVVVPIKRWAAHALQGAGMVVCSALHCSQSCLKLWAPGAYPVTDTTRRIPAS